MCNHSYHGVFPEENKLGQQFIVDMKMSLSLLQIELSDNIEDGISYVEVVEVISTFFDKNVIYKTVERLAGSIAQTCLKKYPCVEQLTISVGKLNPAVPLIRSLQPGAVGITITRSREHYPHLFPQHIPISKPDPTALPLPPAPVSLLSGLTVSTPRESIGSMQTTRLTPTNLSTHFSSTPAPVPTHVLSRPSSTYASPSRAVHPDDPNHPEHPNYHVSPTHLSRLEDPPINYDHPDSPTRRSTSTHKPLGKTPIKKGQYSIL